MPAIVWAAVIAGGAQVGGTLAQNRAARLAGQQQDRAFQTQMGFERQQADEDQRRWDETQRRNREMYDQTRAEEQRRYEADRALEAERWNTEQTRRAPYRQVSTEQLRDLHARTLRGNTLADLARR